MGKRGLAGVRPGAGHPIGGGLASKRPPVSGREAFRHPVTMTLRQSPGEPRCSNAGRMSESLSGNCAVNRSARPLPVRNCIEANQDRQCPLCFCIHSTFVLISISTANDMAVRTLKIAAARDVFIVFLFEFHLTEKEEINIIARQVLISGSGEPLAGHSRCYQMRRDNDYKIGLVLLERFTGEQGAEHRHRTDPG
jgi:hypothetical protein